MNMKRLLSLLAFFATVQASAQQVNPVPDYVFANRMSAGRNTVTDTAAYFSIGPRYGATRGMMPPMVVDTASFSANKRNGLLIFSVQKNKFLYWDSVGVKWAEMAGTAGTALTSADTAALLSTRAWRQKGIDSLAAIRIAGSGTINYVSKFSATRTLSNSQIFDNGTNVGINTTTPTDYLSFGRALEINSSSFGAALYLKSTASTTYGYLGYDRSALQTILGAVGTSTGIRFDANGSTRMTLTSGGDFGIGTVSPSGRLHLSSTTAQQIFRTDESTSNYSYTQGLDNIGIYYTNNSASRGYRWENGGSERMRIFSNGRVGINTGSTDAGDFNLQVKGNAYVEGSLSINTSGQTRTITTFKGTLANGSNIFIGGGGASSNGTSGDASLGSLNTSLGVNAMLDLTQGYSNTFVGMSSGRLTTTGYQNSYFGKDAGYNNTTGFRNVGIGNNSMYASGGNNNVAVGYSAGLADTSGTILTTIKHSVLIGAESKPAVASDSNEVVIGYNAKGYGSNTVTIGNSNTTENYLFGSVRTGAPSGGSQKPWRLGEVATVTPTSPNRTIRVEIDGTVYYLHAKTTND